MLPCAKDSRAETIIDVTHDTSRYAHDERTRRHAHPFRHDRPGGDDAACAHMHVIKKNGPHSDEAIVLHRDRKSTRLNSSHVAISYAVFCLKKKKKNTTKDKEEAT